MRKSAMQNIHDMNQRALISYANHDLQRLQNQFGTGQNTTNKKLQQPTNTNNTKSSSLWDELNEGKSKQESILRDELDKPSNVVYIKNPPIVNQQPVQPQNLQLEQMLKRIEELEQSLVQSRQENQEQSNTINNMRNNLVEKDSIIQNKDSIIQNKDYQLAAMQERLLEKTEQVNVEHDKYVDAKHKVDVVKLKLDNFINNHQDVQDQYQLIEMLGDLQIEDHI